MISNDNFCKAIEILGFKRINNSMTWSKCFGSLDCVMEADMRDNKPIYPEQIQSDSDTTRNFSQPESYVVFICVALLLEKGYRPEHIFLEKTWSLGHSAKSGRADITVYDENGTNVLFIIECKRAGKPFADARKLLFEGRDDKQLFSYLAQARSAKWLQLLAIDYDEEKKDIKILEEIVKSHDDENVVILAEKDTSILLYKNASQAEDLFRVWDETYNKKTYKGLFFGKNTTAYKIGVRPLCKKDLTEFSNDDGITNSFLEILRHNSISDKENAFNKILSLFICKMVDEKEKLDNDEVDFQYKEGTDNYFTLYERLLRLFHRGMDKFLKEDVFYLEDDYISRTLDQYTGKQRKYLEAELKQSFQRTKLLSCQVFAFREIYNEKLFMQNGKVLVEMVELFQNYRLAYSSRKAFLGELFEHLLNQGFKQDEGQFFTPMPITRFIWNSLPIERFINFETRSCPKVIDYACGAGHFLTEGISAISDAFKAHGFTEDKKVTDEEISATFYGVEKDNRLARVSKVALLLNGANEAHIKAMDGLDHDVNFLGEKNTFDILVANPPYAVDAFKSHLERRILKEFDLLQFMSASSKAIEKVFVERIDQLLKPFGVAGVILPSSIMTDDDVAGIKIREMLLKRFLIHCIVYFEGKTFSKTPTSTVVLFLEKRETQPCASLLLKDSVDAIFSDKDLTDWTERDIYSKYLEIIDIKESTYDYFRTQSAEIRDLKSNEYFSQYVTIFESDVEIVKLQKSKGFKALSKDEQAHLLKKRFYDYAFGIEKEKIYYFALASDNHVLIVKAPLDSKKQKEFLGYKSSERKGKQGVTEIEGALSSVNRNDDKKIAWCVKKVFDGDFVNNEASLSYSNYTNLPLLMNFTKPKFNKIIYNVPVSSFKLKSKFDVETVGNLLIPINGNKTKIDTEEILESGESPVITQDRERFISGYTNNKETITDLPLIVFGDHSCCFKFVDFAFVRGADGTQLIKVDENKIRLKYLYYYLSSIEIHNSGKYERHFKYLKETQIPIPPIGSKIQDKIIEECEAIDKEYESSRMTIEEYRSKIETLFVNLNIIETGGVKIKDICKFITERTSHIDMTSYVTTDNMLQNFEGVKEFFGRTEAGLGIAYKKGDILLSNIRPYLKKMWLADKDGSCSPDVLVFRSDTSKVSPEFLYYSLRRDDFIDFIMNNAGTKGIKMPRGNKEEIPNYTIILPSLDQQAILVSKIRQYEESISNARLSIASCPSRKQAILDKYLK